MTDTFNSASELALHCLNKFDKRVNDATMASIIRLHRENPEAVLALRQENGVAEIIKENDPELVQWPMGELIDLHKDEQVQESLRKIAAKLQDWNIALAISPDPSMHYKTLEQISSHNRIKPQLFDLGAPWFLGLVMWPTDPIDEIEALLAR